MIETSASGKPASQEPSMEDILASIRRILADDVAPTPADDTVSSAASAAAAPDEADADGAQPVPAPSPLAMQAEDIFDDPEFACEGDPEPAPVPPPPDAPRRPALARDDVFVLSPEMRAAGHKLVSPQTAEDSTDVLSHLARAILDRRDITVASRDVTLESMVREMLRPLLREWLDRNLPYLIERLVKKEIDLMINRAERLED